MCYAFIYNKETRPNMGRTSTKENKNSYQLAREELGLTRENLTGVRVVRAFDKEKSEVERFENANDLLTKMQLHVGHISA